MSSAFCSDVAPSRVILMFTYGIEAPGRRWLLCLV
jgi:hypothetical protein